MLEDEFGTVDFNEKPGDRVFPKRWRLKSPKGNESETTMVRRVLPPMKSLKEKKQYACFHAQHFGYNGVNKDDPSKVRFLPFGCVREYDPVTKKVSQTCAGCDELYSKKDAKEGILAHCKASGEDPSKYAEKLEPLNEWLKNYNRDGKWYLNAMSPEGEFGTLAITKTCYEALRVLFSKTLKEDGIHGINPSDGVWVKFTRTGYGRDVLDTVEVVYENIQLPNGKIGKTVKLAPLTADQLQSALKICDDLATDPVRYLSPEKVSQIVATGGDPEEIDRIWATSQRTSPADKPSTTVTAPPPSVNADKAFFDQFKVDE